MNLLFLRGEVPGDRPKEQIMFESLAANDDVWTQLAYSLLGEKDYGEIWYEGGNRVTRYADRFVERWVPRYRETTLGFSPTVVFARGGFPRQIEAARRFPGAFRDLLRRR